MDSKKIRKYIRNLLLFLLLIIITFWVVFKDQDITQIYSLFLTVKKRYVLIAILFMCIYVLCESINIGRTLKALKEKTSFWKNIKYALIGFFFSGITPAASGGQPMQVYYMHKEGISVANSTLALLINLTSMQIVTISTALVSILFNYSYLNAPMIGFFVLGICLNLSALLLLLLAIFSKDALDQLIEFIIKIMRKLKIKNLEEKLEKLETEVDKYAESAKYIKNNKLKMIKIILTTYIQFLAFYSVSYWIYKSFGLSGENIMQIVSLQSVLFGTVSGIPSPGAVGVSEGGYIGIFSNIIPANMVSSVMLLTRGINFYLLIFVSGIVTLFNIFNKKKLKKNEI